MKKIMDLAEYKRRNRYVVELLPIIYGLRQALGNLDLASDEREVLRTILDRHSEQYNDAEKALRKYRKNPRVKMAKITKSKFLAPTRATARNSNWENSVYIPLNPKPVRK